LHITDDLSTVVNTDVVDSMSGNPIEYHTRVLAVKLWKAYEVVLEHNKICREDQEIHYDRTPN